MIELVSELLQPPVVGRKYMVECAEAHQALRPHSTYVVPVLLPIHADKEVGGAGVHPHFHVDWRFIPVRTIRNVFGYDFQDAWFASRHFAYALFETGDEMTTNAPRPCGIRSMKCLREMAKWPDMVNLFQPNQLTQKVERLCSGRRMDTATMVCPHKGICLKTMPVDAIGTVTCPGHGLRWDVRTGEMVPIGEPK